MKKIVAIALARLTAMTIRLAPLVLSIVRVGTVSAVIAPVVIVVRRNNASC
jgi:hypothetical protein